MGSLSHIVGMDVSWLSEYSIRFSYFWYEENDDLVRIAEISYAGSLVMLE